MPLSDVLPDIYVPAFLLKVDNQKLDPETAASILEVSCTEYLDPPNEFSFRVHDPTLKLINQTKGPMTEGKRVEMSLGYRDHTQLMIVGEIDALSAEFPNGGAPELEVSGHDLLHAATRGTTHRCFSGQDPDSAMSDSEVITTIAKELNLKPSVDQSPTRKKPWVQDNITTLQLLEDIVAASGFFLWVDGDTLYFKENPPAPATIQVHFGQSLLSFSVRLSTAGQVNAFEVRGYDDGQGQPVKGRAERTTGSLAQSGEQQVARGAGGKSERIIWGSFGFDSAEEAQDHADRLMTDQEQRAVTGSGSSVGRTDIRAGTILDVKGVGRFEGQYQVDSVTHTIGSSGFQTSFEVRKLGKRGSPGS